MEDVRYACEFVTLTPPPNKGMSPCILTEEAERGGEAISSKHAFQNCSWVRINRLRLLTGKVNAAAAAAARSVLVSVYHMTQASAIWEEGMSPEEQPPSDWPTGSSEGYHSGCQPWPGGLGRSEKSS